jgi:enoyl-CoA hydratase
VAVVTLNRPQAMNALSQQLRSEYNRTMTEMKDRMDVDVVIVTGAGRAFCAGLDLKELGGEVDADGDPLDAITNASVVQPMIDFDRPIIAAVNGVAITGGFELALAADFLIASTNARFADTHARVGIMPGWGLSQRLSRLIGIGRAKELSLTGNFLDADMAERWGLVNHVVEPDELLPFCKKLAQDMRSVVPELLRGYKKIIDDGYSMHFNDALVEERRRSEAHRQNVSQDDVRQRRLQIQDRGRVQQG